MAIFRLTGTAEAVRTRKGTNKETGNAWEMRSQSVRVNDFVCTEISIADDSAGYREGETVDLIVDVTVRRGFLSTEVRGEWPKAAPAVPGRALAGASA